MDAQTGYEAALSMWLYERFPTSNTSALPHRLDTERFPCLATFAPAAAAITVAPVLMFTEPMPSPPVPTMSRTSPVVATGTLFSRIAFASPATSSAVSPWSRVREIVSYDSWSRC